MPSVKDMVDEAYQLASEINEKSERLRMLKDILKAEARRQRVQSLNGGKSIARFSDYKRREINPFLLVEKVKEIGCEDDLPKMVKVQIPEARRLLGESLFQKLVRVRTTKYGRITFSCNGGDTMPDDDFLSKSKDPQATIRILAELAEGAQEVDAFFDRIQSDPEKARELEEWRKTLDNKS